ncbi:CG7054 [Drosophila busckii]|uniref:CG7054 n=1 Tax=Drosophila busckii TaxID=30019 RepID=A0A0M4EG25_DROBS|nr:CG7054 [Drosophila busckii]
MEAIVPDVLDVAPPSGKLEVKYPTGVVVQTGNELTPTQVKDEPSVSWAAESTDALYTLLMVDPDAPSRAQPTFREILHWAVVNIVGNQLASGDTLAEQSARVEEDMRIGKRTRDGRFNFSVRKFAAKHGLGQPIAGSFYEAQYDDYVAIRNKEFAK